MEILIYWISLYLKIENQDNIEVGKFEGKVFRTNKEWFPNN